ncbi:hypothetical protein [Herbaspirillum sp. ST 5-3]|uniref:hypothetical protein n=1 Tax=Oxalobacteraceae TaxID=75682 RepID=UPI0014560251|nr:hypothetical protein [Herbaspirillum sp. ST 5-3]
MALRQRVEAEFHGYAQCYEAPPTSTTVGTPWTKEKVKIEVDRMAALLVDPYPVHYESGDEMVPSEQRLVGRRSAFVVAEDDPYVLLFDHDAEDFVLAYRSDDGQLSAWGLRGDAASTFLAR